MRSDPAAEVKRVGDLIVDGDIANNPAVNSPSEDVLNAFLVCEAIGNAFECTRGVSLWSGKERVDKGNLVAVFLLTLLLFFVSPRKFSCKHFLF